MRLVEVKERTPALLRQLLAVWESSVRATHLFLTDGEIIGLRGAVSQALQEVPRLIVAEGEGGLPIGLMGIDGQRLEMLFLSDGARGKGIGKRLLVYGIEAYSVRELAVNEQNPQAKGFYERLGFQVYRRTERDGQGNPHPLLYMRLDR